MLTDEQAAAIHVNPGYFKDTSDAVFMTTRPVEGAEHAGFYDRSFLEGFIRGGIGARNWVSRTNYPALNVVQTGPTEMSVYVNQDYAQPTAQSAGATHCGWMALLRCTPAIWAAR